MDNLTKKIILGVLSVFMFFRTGAMEVAGLSGETWAEPSSHMVDMHRLCRNQE